jgi:hypothetical protein
VAIFGGQSLLFEVEGLQIVFFRGDGCIPMCESSAFLGSLTQIKLLSVVMGLKHRYHGPFHKIMQLLFESIIYSKLFYFLFKTALGKLHFYCYFIQ